MSVPIKVPCVYCILNLHTNRRYVGSTSNFSGRRNQHKYDLRNSKHYSKIMQSDYDVYGEDSFRFFKLEEVPTFDRDYLFEREQFWIDKYTPEYNNNEKAGNVFPSSIYTDNWRKAISERNKGRRQSQEEKDKRAKSIHEFWKDKKKVISPEQREKLRLANLGEKNPNWGLHRSESTKKFMSKKMGDRHEYTFSSPDGEIIVFTNLSNPQTDIDIPPYWVLRKLLRKENVPSYSGWTFISKKSASALP